MTWQLLKTLPNQRILYGKQSRWAIHADKVYYYKDLIRHADNDTFQIWFDVQNNDYGLLSKDKNHVYFGRKKTKLDSATIQEYHCWWTDKNGVYIEGENSLYPIKGADSDTFQQVGESYAIDKNHAYYYGQLLKPCTNPQKLRLLNQPLYATDDENVYWAGKLLKGANPQTWRPITLIDDDSYSTDGEGVYWCNHKLGFAKFDEWQYLIDGYSKSKKAVYHLAWAIKDGNPQEWDEQKAIAYAQEQQRLSDEYHQAMLKQLGHIECES